MVWLPWGEFVRRGPAVWRHLASDGLVFLRPDSGQKTFVGQTFSLDDFEQDVHALDVSSGVMAGTLIGVCRPKPVDDGLEWRVWLGARGVIASTPYSWDEDSALSPVPDAVTALANEVAGWCADERNWTPDRVFVADFCLSAGRPRLVEINSASCSGVYGANLVAVAEGLVEAVMDEIG